MPSAVSRDRDGYLRVDYDRLGLEFMTWDEWVARTAQDPERCSDAAHLRDASARAALTTKSKRGSRAIPSHTEHRSLHHPVRGADVDHCSAPPPCGWSFKAIRMSAANASTSLIAQFVPGMRLQMWDCNNSAAQTFSYDDTNQQLTIGNLCVESWGRGDPQDAVGLGSCNGGANQHWRMVASKDYYQIIGINNRCLELRYGLKDNGAALDIRTATPRNRNGFGRCSKPRRKTRRLRTLQVIGLAATIAPRWAASQRFFKRAAPLR